MTEPSELVKLTLLAKISFSFTALSWAKDTDGKNPIAHTHASFAQSFVIMIESARNTLNSVNFGPLSKERKKAYNDAKLFLQQAEDALKDGNLVFAESMAKKAETLDKELAGR